MAADNQSESASMEESVAITTNKEEGEPSTKRRAEVTSLLGINAVWNRNMRLSILTLAAKGLDHEDAKGNDEFMDLGMAASLQKTLSTELHQGANSREVLHVCRILSKLYGRCSDGRAEASFRDVGADLLPLLFLAMEIDYRLGGREVTRAAKCIIRRYASLAVPLGPTRRGWELVRFLLGVINGGTSGRVSVHAAALIVAGLSLSVENKRELVQFPGLLDALVNVAAKYIYTDTRREAANALMLLAWDASCKSVMAKHPSCVNVLLELTEDASYQVNCLALEALNHLSTAAENKVALTYHRGGMILDALLIFAADTSRLRTSVWATNALANLAFRPTATAMGNHPDLLGTLSALAATCADDGVAGLAAMAMKKLATHIRRGDRCHDRLLASLVRMSSGTNPDVLAWTARAFAHQATNERNRKRMAGFGGLIGALFSLARGRNCVAKTAALEAIGALALHEASATRIAGNFVVLRALIEISAREDRSDEPEMDAARRLAVKTILSLATHSGISERMAKQQGLVASLSRYGSSDDEDVELKRAATHGVLLLAPLL